jgi:hypothetical protein
MEKPFRASLFFAHAVQRQADFVQKINEQVGVAVSEPEAVATGQRFNLRIVA